MGYKCLIRDLRTYLIGIKLNPAQVCPKVYVSYYRTHCNIHLIYINILIVCGSVFLGDNPEKKCEKIGIYP
jgi:hypothetical protein